MMSARTRVAPSVVALAVCTAVMLVLAVHWSTPSPERALVAAATTTEVPASTTTSATSTTSYPTVSITLGAVKSAATNHLANGLTHAQYSADPWGDQPAISRAKALLAAEPILQNQHIMGWGVINPEPAPDVFDWSALDRRLALIRSTGGTPVITLCCSPDWMKGGVAGTTDWKKLTTAPTPDHYHDFADLAADVAERYPDVHRFVVWNEMKGFWNTAANRWNYEGYTEMYNLVYAAIKQVRPDAEVGGPYVPMVSSQAAPSASSLTGAWGTVDERALDAVRYWLAHNIGADFVAVDGSSVPRSGMLVTDPFTSTEKFAAVTDWLKRQTALPIWWSEWYVEPKGSGWTPEIESAVMTTALVNLARSGAATALRWQPQQDVNGALGYLWTDTRVIGGGQESPFGASFASFVERFPRGTPLVATHVSSSAVVAMASPQTLLVINTGAVPVRVNVRERVLALAPYEVLYQSI